MANYQDRQIHEECGVFGVFGVEKAASLTYYGLHSLQHRGQEGCGIVSVDNRTFHRVKGEGLVTEVFNEDNLRTLTGNMAIGHVRYSTTGGGGIDNVQPFMFMHSTGDFALAHNGNLVNSFQLKTFLEERGSLFHSTSDSEIFAHLIKKETDSRDRIFPILEALNMVEGAFALLIMTASKIYACRDKHGLRPLSIGKLGDGYVVSSETCAFEVVGAEFIRDVAPGEVVIIDVNGLQIDGPTAKVMNSEPLDHKMDAFGFNTIICNGNSLADLEQAFILFDRSHGSGKPPCFLLHTTKGLGVSFMENAVDWHGKAPNDAEYDKAMAELRASYEVMEKEAERING